MQSALAAFLIALVMGTLLTPLVKRLAFAVGAVDEPGGRRVHKRAIPRMGGVAIVAAFFVPLVALYVLQTGVAQIFYAEPLRAVGLGVGGLLICLLGLWDDLKGMRALLKLGVQVVAALVAFSCGFRIDAISLPVLGYMEMGIFAAPVTVLWIVGAVNALNLIDGLDGLAGGVAFLACVANFLIGFMNMNPLVMLLSAALGGAVLAFLIYNFNPASIFMGDAGSMFLGFVLALTGLMGSAVKSSTAVSILVPCLAMGVPIADMLLAIGRRALARQPIFSADRGHLHHRLLDLGLTHRRAVVTLYGVSAVFVGAALLVNLGRLWEVGGGLVMGAIVAIGLVFFVINTERRSRQLAEERAALEQATGLTPRVIASVGAALLRVARAPDEVSLRCVLRELAEGLGARGVEVRRLGEGSWSWHHPEGSGRDVCRLEASLGVGEEAGAIAVLFAGVEGDPGDDLRAALGVLGVGVGCWYAERVVGELSGRVEGVGGGASGLEEEVG